MMIQRQWSRGKTAEPPAGIPARRTLKRLDAAAEHGQGRAQFVTGIGDEIGPHFLDHLYFGDIEQGDHQHRTVGRRRAETLYLGVD